MPNRSTKSRSAAKGGTRSARARVQQSRGDAFQSPQQRAQVEGRGAPAPDPANVRRAEDHQKRLHVAREVRAQASARGAGEAEAQRLYQEAYDNPDKFEAPPPLGSEEERKLLEKLGREQPGGGDEFTARAAAQGSPSSRSSSGKPRSSGRSRGKAKGKSGQAGKAQASASESAKAEQAGSKTTTEGKGEPSI